MKTLDHQPVEQPTGEDTAARAVLSVIPQVEDPYAILGSAVRFFDQDAVGQLAIGSAVAEATDITETSDIELAEAAAKNETNGVFEKRDFTHEEVAISEDRLISHLEETLGHRVDKTRGKHDALHRLIYNSSVGSLMTVYDADNGALWDESSLVAPLLIDKAGEVIRRVGLRDGQKLDNYEQQFISKLFSKFGLEKAEAANVLMAWRSQNDKDLSVEENARAQKEIVTSNFRRMYLLQRGDPEAVPKLYRMFGIRHFNRYHLQQLFSQLKGDIRQPAQLVLSAARDFNGALANVGTEAEDVLGEGLIFTEAESAYEAARRMIGLSKEYGTFKTLLINAHGTPRDIRLGTHKNQIFTDEDIEKSRGIKRLTVKGILDKRAIIIVNACNTGSKKGFARALAKASGTKVFAPSFETTGAMRTQFNRIKFTQPVEGKPVLKPARVFSSRRVYSRRAV